jgi:hypothetical protein
MLTGLQVQYDNTLNQDYLIQLGGFYDRTHLLTWTDWTLATEYAGTESDEGWYTITAAGQWPPMAGPLHDELLQVATDGSGRVRRICHLQNKLIGGNYDSIPQPACGYGAFPWIAFHSSWGDRGRRDVFLAEARPADVPVTPNGEPCGTVCQCICGGCTCKAASRKKM